MSAEFGSCFFCTAALAKYSRGVVVNGGRSFRLCKACCHSVSQQRLAPDCLWRLAADIHASFDVTRRPHGAEAFRLLNDRAAAGLFVAECSCADCQAEADGLKVRSGRVVDASFSADLDRFLEDCLAGPRPYRRRVVNNA